MTTQQLLQAQYDVVLAHKGESGESRSYTVYLFQQGLDKILKKCGEETFEAVIALKEDDTAETVGELNDVLYHLTVLLCLYDIPLTDMMAELNRRVKAEGLDFEGVSAAIAARREENAPDSYTAYLFGKGLNKILKKVGEACALLLIAGKAGDKAAIAAESADLVYHLMAAMLCKEIPCRALTEELWRRSEKTGNLKQFHTTDLNS